MVHKTLLIQLIITSISSVIFSFLGWGVLGPSIGLFLGALFGHLIILLLGNKMLPFKLKPSDLKVKSGPLTGQIKKLARDNFLISLANKLSFTADSIIIGTIYSPALVAPFFLTQRLPSLAMQQLQNLTHATWASLVDYHHKDEKEKFEEKFLETLKFLLIAAGNGLLPIIIFNDDFVRLWVGRTNYISLEFTIVSCFVALAVAIDFYFSTLLKGVGVVKEQVKPEFVFGILNVILSIILAKFVSVSGPVWATFFSVTLIVVVSKVPLIKATFGIKFRRVILGAILPFIWTMVMGYAFYQLKLKLNIAINWVSLPLLVATLMLIFLSATWLFILNQKEKRIWLERFKRILKLN
jgi:O-antigen/teichoic acid export membrane protein